MRMRTSHKLKMEENIASMPLTILVDFTRVMKYLHRNNAMIWYAWWLICPGRFEITSNELITRPNAAA